jgi:hypothetical protein
VQCTGFGGWFPSFLWFFFPTTSPSKNCQFPLKGRMERTFLSLVVVGLLYGYGLQREQI